MAVLCEAISVVVDVRALAERFPGGLAGYAAAVPNRTFCCDGSVARVGFMATADAARWVDAIASAGLTIGTPGADVAVVDQVVGITSPCDWLLSASDGSVRIAWRADQEPAQTYVPQGWTRDLHDAISYLPRADHGDALMTSDGKLVVMKDPRTGRPLYQPQVTEGP
jgi:hypothetical protein